MHYIINNHFFNCLTDKITNLIPEGNCEVKKFQKLLIFKVFERIRICYCITGSPHFTRGLYFCQMDSHYVMHYTISSLYTVKKHYLSIKDTVFHFTRISLYTIYLEKQKSCKVRATCISDLFRNCILIIILW